MSDHNSPCPDPEVLLGRLAEEFLHETWLGNQPNIDEIAEQHPEIAELIKEVFPTLQLAAEMDVGEPTLRLSCPNPHCQDGRLFPASIADRTSNKGDDHGGNADRYSDVLGSEYVCTECGQSVRLAPIEPRPGVISPAESTFATLARIESAIARYEIKGGKLGEGGFGTVWLADDGRDWVAMKIPRTRPSAEQWRRYVSEVKVHSQLPQHPNVVSIRDYGKDGDTYFIVLEYKNAEQLSCRTQRSSDVALRLIQRITSAVAHLHTNGIAHRDLSPKNILIDVSDPTIPYLLDFGLAKCFQADGGYERDLTSIGQIVGSRRYMSPEQRSGTEGHDLCRSDVFSLGVICFELLTREYPFVGRDTSEQVANKDAGDSYPDLSLLDKCVSRKVKKLVARCLEKNPHDRFANASELEVALHQIADSDDDTISTSKWTNLAAIAFAILLVFTGWWLFVHRNAADAGASRIAARASSGPLRIVDAYAYERDGDMRTHINAKGGKWDSLAELFEDAFPSLKLREVYGVTVRNAQVTLHDTDFQEPCILEAIELLDCDLKLRLSKGLPAEYIVINACKGIQSLDVSIFPNAKYIELDGMPELTTVVGFGELDVEVISLARNPGLEKVEGIANHPSLYELDVIDCNQLGSEIGTHLRSLTKLRTLTLTWANLITLDLLADCQDLQTICIEHSPALIQVSTLRELKRLRMLCVTNCPRIDWHSLGEVAHVEIFGDSWTKTAVGSVTKNPVRNVSDYWIWREEMIRDRAQAKRFHDTFIDP